MAELIRAGGFKDRSDFELLLAQRFPAIAAEIDDIERGLLHMEMAVLARATCRAAGPDLENAVYVSYLENVFLGSEDPRHESARAMLSKRLQAALS